MTSIRMRLTALALAGLVALLGMGCQQADTGGGETQEDGATEEPTDEAGATEEPTEEDT